MNDTNVAEVAAQRERLVAELRAYGGTYAEVSRHFAGWLGVYSTDASALLEILTAEERGEPISPARLSERIGLSSGATTALLNRLESAGHIVRSREHTDRRVITLRSTPTVQKLADRFFNPLEHRLDAMMTSYPPALLEQFERFLGDLRATLHDHLAQQGGEAAR